jgi:hypothetical protein
MDRAQLDLHLLLGGECPVEGDGLVDELRKLEGCRVDIDQPRLDRRDIEQLIDQLEGMGGQGVDAAEESPVWSVAGGLALQDLTVGVDRPQGVSQVVGSDAQQLVLAPIELFQLSLALEEFAGALGD